MTDAQLSTASWLHNREALERFAKTLDPAVSLHAKSSIVWRVLSVVIRDFDKAATTIGPRVYFADEHPYDYVKSVIPHEVLGHVRQFRWCGLGSRWAGCLIFALLYVVLFLPLYLAWPRYRLELHADTASWRYHLEQELWSYEDVRARAKYFGAAVASQKYLYALPRFWVLWGFRRRAETVIRQHKRKLSS